LIHSEQRMNSLNVASASTHELNQPLTVVMGSLELLSSRDDLPAGVSPRLQRAYVQLQRMADIVRELSHAPHRETRPPFSQQI